MTDYNYVAKKLDEEIALCARMSARIVDLEQEVHRLQRLINIGDGQLASAHQKCDDLNHELAEALGYIDALLVDDPTRITRITASHFTFSRVKKLGKQVKELTAERDVMAGKVRGLESVQEGLKARISELEKEMTDQLPGQVTQTRKIIELREERDKLKAELEKGRHNPSGASAYHTLAPQPDGRLRIHTTYTPVPFDTLMGWATEFNCGAAEDERARAALVEAREERDKLKQLVADMAFERRREGLEIDQLQAALVEAREERDQFAKRVTELATRQVPDVSLGEWLAFFYSTAYEHGTSRSDEPKADRDPIARAQWEYLRRVLTLVGVDTRRIKAAGSAYFKGFIEGFKHGN
jgi:chromosome segregation ATPase